MAFSIYLSVRLGCILKLDSFGAAKVSPVLAGEERYSSPEKSPRDGIGGGGRGWIPLAVGSRAPAEADSSVRIHHPVAPGTWDPKVGGNQHPSCKCVM